MKVLWFEVSVPSKYTNSKKPIAGWQDSLENIVRQSKAFDIYIAFEGSIGDQVKVIDGITYIPIIDKKTFIDRQKDKISWESSRNRLIPLALSVIKKVSPDIIHVFGSEWCWGQVQKDVQIPVVIHMQGSMPPYFNAHYPPGYSELDIIKSYGFNLKKQFNGWLSRKKEKTWVQQEEKTLRTVSYYMGRTKWDHTIVKLYNPQAKYFYCSEALRPSFVESKDSWCKTNRHKVKLITVGASTFWKGLDTILKTAHILKMRNFNFEWNICGNMPLQSLVENKECLKFADNHVIIRGFVGPQDLKKELLSSDLYVHTAYIDNSPNSICEAQYLGLPIISTNVGGISSLIEDGKEGVLVPANDPFSMAQYIIELSAQNEKCIEYGLNSMNRARIRHNPNNILRDLMYCYESIIADYKQ